MPFTNAYHGGAREPSDLSARIDAELRSRIEDAVDFACLDAMVRAREARGAPPPAADDPRDRDEYTARVSAFLDELSNDLIAGLSDEQRGRFGLPRRNDVAAALAVQISLAKVLPDYWQRFDAVRLRVAEDARGPSAGGASGAGADVAGAASGANRASSRQRRGLLDWLLGRG
jgi:hypothetical protein